MVDKPGKGSLYSTAARAYQEVGTVVPRPTIGDAPGDSDAVKRYRRFFETHDLRGLPRDTARRPVDGTARAAPR